MLHFSLRSPPSLRVVPLAPRHPFHLVPTVIAVASATDTIQRSTRINHPHTLFEHPSVRLPPKLGEFTRSVSIVAMLDFHCLARCVRRLRIMDFRIKRACTTKSNLLRYAGCKSLLLSLGSLRRCRTAHTAGVVARRASLGSPDSRLLFSERLAFG